MKHPSLAPPFVTSGVGVLDKAVVVLAAVSAEPAALAELVAKTGLPRATTYRLATALETHGLLARDPAGRFVVGQRLSELAATARRDPLEAVGPDILARLRDVTGESTQLYRRFGRIRRCVASAEPASGLRDTVPVGAELPMTAGSAAQVLLAWDAPEEAVSLLRRAAFGPAQLATVRRRGWAASVAEREAGVASVSAPVFDSDGRVAAALSVSGPIDRLTRSPGRLHAANVVAAAAALTKAVIADRC